MNKAAAPATPALEILPYSRERAPYFGEINRAWIKEMFTLEDIDRKVLNDPQTHIIDPGGDILFVAAAPHGIIGAGALKFHAPGVYELTKMGVTAEARGKKAGEALLDALIVRAQELGAQDLVLLTNSACKAAIHLYEKTGFHHSEGVNELLGSLYCRCDVSMRYGGANLSHAAKALS